MKLKCISCGHDLATDIQYCPECGNKIEKQPKRKFSKKLITLLSLGLLLVVSFIVFYLVGNSQHNPIHKINSFEEAVLTENQEELTNLLVAYEDSFTITEDNIATLLSFFQENPDSFETIINKLKEEAESYQNGDVPSTSETYATITLEKNGSRWLFFDDYKLVVIPAFIEVFTTDNSVELFIDEEKIDTTVEEGVHEKKYGPFMPGTHVLKALFDNSYASTEEEIEINLFNMDSNSTRQEIEVNVGNFNIVSTFEDEATLFVNDQETDIIINKGSQVVGPFPLSENIEIHLQKEMPWETIISQSEIINDDVQEIRISKVPTISDSEEEKIIQIINDVFLTYTEALNARDVSLLQDHITENMIQTLEEQIEYIEEEIPEYEGTLRKAQYRVDWYQDPEYDEEVEAYVFDIDVMFTYYEPNGNLGRLFKGENDHEYERGVKVFLLYDEQEAEWKIDQFDNRHFFVFEEDPVYELE
ncbi:hypothetical protein GMD78_01240 [Ornithinibacillus sp. L9]|uniref:Membrane-associated protein n=1 Tax=Ornithinibacillus caprae TaxID=2678566 RepID=A0A6N8FEC5_9BACI|nr:hypothetical protein [Ornithinibacillus caprae]MUK87026.1 hypothetical protein [Ornithinibacillus caprae]